MPKFKKTDRRQYPRIEHKLPLNIAANGYDFATSTQNVSCIGAYCRIDKYVPPFTKIAIKITLPIAKENKVEKINFDCKGVIVRTEDEKKGGFNIAIFFSGIKEGHKKKISQYISQFLPKKTSCTKRL